MPADTYHPWQLRDPDATAEGEMTRLMQMPVRMWQEAKPAPLRRCMRCYSTQLTTKSVCDLPRGVFGYDTCGGPLVDIPDR